MYYDRPSINLCLPRERRGPSEQIGVEAVLLGEPLHNVVYVVGGAFGDVEVGGLRVGVLTGLGADVLVIHAEPIEGVPDALEHGLAPYVGDPKHRLSLQVSSLRCEVEVGEAPVLLYDLTV